MAERSDQAALLLQFLADRDVACPRCGYNLRDCPGLDCPECNERIRLTVGTDDGRAARRVVAMALAWALMIGAAMTLSWLVQLAAMRLLPPGKLGFGPWWMYIYALRGWHGLVAGAAVVGLIRLYTGREGRWNPGRRRAWMAAMWVLLVLEAVVLSGAAWWLRMLL